MSAADCDRRAELADALVEAIPELVADPALRQRIETVVEDFYADYEEPLWIPGPERMAEIFDAKVMRVLAEGTAGETVGETTEER